MRPDSLERFKSEGGKTAVETTRGASEFVGNYLFAVGRSVDSARGVYKGIDLLPATHYVAACLASESVTDLWFHWLDLCHCAQNIDTTEKMFG